MDRNPPFEPEPHLDTQPPLPWCHVLPNLTTMDYCKRPWDREHTVLGFAICRECYEEVRFEP